MGGVILIAALGIIAASLAAPALCPKGVMSAYDDSAVLTVTPVATASVMPTGTCRSTPATPPATAVISSTQEAEAAGVEKGEDVRSTPEAEGASSRTVLRTEWTTDGKALYIWVEGAHQLYAVDLQITFDASRYQVADTDPARSGVQIKPGEAPTPDFVAANKADNQQGVVRYVATQLGSAPGFSGSGLVATVMWRRSADDRSGVALGPVLMVDREAQAIQVVLE